jgi:lysophospholipase L1-like esterase
MSKSTIIAALVLAGLALFFWYRPGTPEIVNRQPGGINIICFGDSLTAGVGAEAGQDYPAHLAWMLGREVINLGLPGDTTASALARLDQVLSRQPRIVLLTLGGNDIRQGVPQAAAFANLEEIVRRIQAEGALVVIGGIDIPFFSRGFGAGYRDLARRTGSVLIPDVFSGIWGRPELMSDQVHPNPAGYRLMAGHFRQALEPYL